MEAPVIGGRDGMEQMLYKAAVEGNVTSLQELLQKDPLIIDRVILNCSTETPLHVAAMLGHADFAKEVLRQKPELAAELDYRRSTLLHLASAKGHIEIVKALLSINPEMCLASDRDGRNPVHLAAMKGRVDVLKKLSGSRPGAARATTRHGETILHLCVKHNQLEALKLLVETTDAQELVSARDDDGFTILHLAVADKQIETINYLLTSTTMEVNAVNRNGCTALDILAQSRRDLQDMEINELLRHAGASRAKNTPFPARESGSVRTRGLSSHANDQNRMPRRHKGADRWVRFTEKKKDWLNKQQSALMIVSSLIATIAFQAGMSPPGNIWGDNSTEDSKDTLAPSSMPEGFPRFMVDNYPKGYGSFLVANTISFLASLSIVLLLISGLPINNRLFVWILMVIMWVAVSTLAVSYTIVVAVFTTKQKVAVIPQIVAGCGILVWTGLMVLLLALHTILLILMILKKLIKFIFRKWRRSSMHGTTV